MLSFDKDSSALALFSNLTITGNAVDSSRVLPWPCSWLSIALQITAVSGAGASCDFSIQWSFNGGDWFDSTPPDDIGTATAPVGAIKMFQVKAPYWRLKAVMSGSSPSFTLTGNAMYIG